mgnify:CR=1 FL=1
MNKKLKDRYLRITGQLTALRDKAEMLKADVHLWLDSQQTNRNAARRIIAQRNATQLTQALEAIVERLSI